MKFILGPNIASLSKAESIVEASDKDHTDDFTNMINDYDYGVSIGLEIDFFINEQKFQADFRYNHSLNALYDGGEWDWARHNLFSLSLCYILITK